MNKFNIRDRVMTRDGEGIVKRIEEGYTGIIFYTVALRVPYKVIDPYQNKREYFPHLPLAWGYTYSETELKSVIEGGGLRYLKGERGVGDDYPIIDLKK